MLLSILFLLICLECNPCLAGTCPPTNLNPDKNAKNQLELIHLNASTFYLSRLNECVSVIKITKDDFKPNMAIESMNDNCRKNFKLGHLATDGYDNGLLDKDIAVFGGWVLEEYEVDPNSKDELDRLRGDGIAHVQYNYSHTEKIKVTRTGSHVVYLYRDKKYDASFVNETRPACAIYGKLENSSIFGKRMIVSCANVFNHVPKQELWTACLHMGYKDCEEKKYETCVKYTFKNGDNYFANHYSWILNEAEKPYGKDCPPMARGSPCTQDCKGPWSDWTKEPPNQCAYNRLHKKERYRSKTPNDLPCSRKNRLACCIEVVETDDIDDCYDYDKTLSVKITEDSCKNGGTRVKDEHNHYKCECPGTMEGLLCDNDICAGKCYNGGTCIPQDKKATKYTCTCTLGFIGARCTEKDLKCANGKPCLNGGVCLFEKIGEQITRQCECPMGYGGELCERKTDYCTAQTCGGNGVCHNVTETFSFKCVCKKGFKGIKCEQELTMTSSIMEFFVGQSAGWLYLVVGWSVTLILFSGGKTYVHVRRRRRMLRAQGGGAPMESVFSSMVSTMFSTKQSAATSKFSTRK